MAARLFGGREADGDGVGMHVQAEEQDGAVRGPGRTDEDLTGGGGRLDACLALDCLGVAEYVGLHGVCSSFIRCLGRESHHLWPGAAHAAQATFTPESRRRFRFHRKPYCLGHKP